MNADAIFAKGKASHALHGKTSPACQDYCRHGETPEGPLVLVSDGCSSSPDTDIGARLLVVAAEEFLSRNPDASPETLGRGTLAKARAVLAMTALPAECLDATLLVGRVEDDGIARVYMWGDGVVAAQYRDGSQAIFVVEYESGAPAYLNYHDSPRMGGYIAQFGTKYTITTYENGEVTGVDEGENPHLDPVPFGFDPNEAEMVLLCSDGVQTFQAKDPGTNAPIRIPVEDVVGRLLGINRFAGEFLARRVGNRFLGRHCKKEGWEHHDDLAVGGLWLGPAPIVEEEGEV